MTVNLLTEHHLEFLSLKRGYTGSSESTLVKMPLCWKSHVAAQVSFDLFQQVLIHVKGEPGEGMNTNTDAYRHVSEEHTQVIEVRRGSTILVRQNLGEF